MKNDALLKKFMEVVLSRMSDALASIHAIEKILLERGIVSYPELKQAIEDAKNLPEQLTNQSTLNQMIKEFNSEKRI